MLINKTWKKGLILLFGFIVLYLSNLFLHNLIKNIELIEFLFNLLPLVFLFYLTQFLSKHVPSSRYIVWVIALVFFIINFKTVSLVFSFIHESGHLIAALLCNLKITEFKVDYSQSYVHTDPYYITPSQVLIVAPPGTLFLLIVCFIILIWITFNNKIKFGVFIGIFLVIGVSALNNIIYWFNSMKYNIGDFQYLLYIIPNINIVKVTLFWECILIISIIFLFGLIIIKVLLIYIHKINSIVPDLNFGLNNIN